MSKAALFSGSRCYFFSGKWYIRVTRGNTGPGKLDPGYPKNISVWNFPGTFGKNGIDAALYSGTKTYFFSGKKYIRVTRGDTGPGKLDPGYPKNISVWNWPSESGCCIRLHLKILTHPIISVDTMLASMRQVYNRYGFHVELGSTEFLNLPALNDVDVGACTMGSVTAEQTQLFANRNNASATDVVIYFVRSTVPPYFGCAAFPARRPGAVVARNATTWTMAHEVGHVLGLSHVNNNDRLMTGNGTNNITNVPPDLVNSETNTMLSSNSTRPCN